MSKLILVQGPPASGKSTWAQEWQKQNPRNRVIISRDALRHMRGVYWVPCQEGFIFEVMRNILHDAMTYDYDICLDETNMNPKNLARWYQMAKQYHYDVFVQKFEVPFEECVRRDASRISHNVGEDVIRNFFETYNIDLKTGKITL